ncbi:head GIN domain-containing protein [Sphingomonas sp. RB3P16]|uniref:head GIN domain-containing protein n=1 Tax=Parasphingomonas frigoris TaxID=3096163 RepID=UPI002FC60BE9
MRVLPVLIVLPLAACSVQSEASPAGAGDTRSFTIADFSGVSLRGSDDVDVRVGSAFSVRATGPRAELDKLEIVRDGDTLRVGRKRNLAGWSWGGSHDRVKVFVTMPRIVAAQIAGSGNLAIDRVEGTRFDADAAGSGNLTVATLTVPRAKLSVAGAGNIEARGRVERLTINVAGSGNVAAAGLKARTASVSVTGSGNVRADVAGPASVSLIGSGNVDLGRTAACSTTKIGSGEVRCGG